MRSPSTLSSQWNLDTARSVRATSADSWKLVERAEELGFSHAWFYDTQMLCADLFVTMALAAERVEAVGDMILVFKERKTWVIYDFDTGANRQLSESVGCVSHRSIADTPAGRKINFSDFSFEVPDMAPKPFVSTFT